MKWICLLCCVTNLAISQENEVEAFLDSLPSAPLEEAQAFLQSLDAAPCAEKKCSAHPVDSELFHTHTDHKLMVFTSLSMPLESWKEHAVSLKKTGGVFVLQGLPDNSFALLSKKIVQLREAGMDVEILLDPPAFEKYHIGAVPACVLDDGKHYDKVAGNLKIPSILSLFADQGETSETAKKLLKALEAL